MGIILAILKILGILLLAVLGVILTLIVLILLVPVRYRLECLIDGPEGGAEEPGFGKPHGRVRITWLMHFVSLTLSYDGKAKVCLRLLGIRLLPGRQKGQKGPALEDGEGPIQNGQDRAGASGEKGTPPVLEETEGPASERGERPPGAEAGEKAGEGRSEEEPLPLSPDGDETAWGKEEGPKEPQEDADGEKLSLPERICRMLRGLAEWLSQWYRNTEYAVKRLSDKVESIKEQCGFYLGLLGGEDAHRLYRKTADVAGRLLGHMKPSRMTAELEVGTGDPASTGQILALWGMLYPLVGENIRITPDFDRKYLAGEIYIKGRIRACVILFHGMRMVLDRRLWRLIRQLKKGGRN